MLKKFNALANLILQQYSNVQYHLNDEDIQFQNKTIAIVPGSFKPPHKGHWQMIMHYVPNVDKVIVLISNISTKANSQRKLSLSNLKKLGKIQSFIKQNNLKQCYTIMNNINQKIDNVNFVMLQECFSELKNICQQNQNQIYNELKQMIQQYQNQLSNTLFKSIRKAGQKEITPEISKEIFEIFAKTYNVSDKVEIRISNSASPISDTIYFINYKCKNCKILLGVSKKGGDQKRWNDIQRSIKNQTVQVIPDPVDVQTMLSATDLRNNIFQLKKQYFPEKLSENDFQNIKNILG